MTIQFSLYIELFHLHIEQVFALGLVDCLIRQTKRVWRQIKIQLPGLIVTNQIRKHGRDRSQEKLIILFTFPKLFI